MRIVQISDIHLAPFRPSTLQHFQVALECVENESPDLVIISGDICTNGDNDPSHYGYAKAYLENLTIPWRAIPGNHDVGCHLNEQTGKTLKMEALERFREFIGPDRWTEQDGNVKIVAINSELAGSGSLEEREQLAWIRDEITSSPSGGSVVFMHSMVYINDVDEKSCYWTLDPEPRKELLGIFHEGPVKAVFNGHLHCHFEIEHDGLPIYSCPAIGFPINDDPFPHRGDSREGYFVIETSDKGISYEKKLLPPDRLE